ncbi:MAG: hypothetical protein ACLQMT_08360 [Candidatus Acidiferrales bacterium]
MTSKISSPPINSPANAKKPPADGGVPTDSGAQWEEARQAYPLYAALATQFHLAPLLHPSGGLPSAQPAESALDRDLLWLDAIDEKVMAFQIRQLPPELLNASEGSLRALLRRQLRRSGKTAADRDKIDFLLVQYFALCAPADFCRREISPLDVARVLQPVLPEADATPLEWCQPLDKILDELGHCQSLRDIMERGLLEQGRLLKDSAGFMFYDPAALVAFCRFNFLLRRAFIRLLHADLSAVREAIEALEAKGIRTADCRRAGFSAAETTAQLRHFCENWRQPFQKDYTENSVRHAFEQLLALRADLEEALGRGRPATSPATLQKKQSPDVADPQAPAAARTPSPAPAAPEREKPVAAHSPAPEAPPSLAALRKQAASAPASPTGAAEADKCLEAIWEQLIAIPPSRGRSMSTVVLQDTKVLLSSWEVSAFVSEGSQESEDLRRAVVARALLAVGTDERKRSGNSNALASALVLARSEVSYFHGRVEQAKAAKNTEAAVNLGISTKRLLSFIEEAEKLQP